MENKPIVIYHKDCPDGLAAAWCFWKEYGDKYDYYAGVYSVSPPDIFNKDVYMVDFSYKHDVMEIICRYANNVILLDHHKSALEDLWDLNSSKINFDMSFATTEKSGAMIAWDYVKQKENHKRKIPQILKHIEDRDLWKFELPHTKEIMSAVFSYDKTLESYDKLMRLSSKGIKDLISVGTVLERKFNLDITGLIRQCKRIVDFEGHKVPMANLNGMYASEAGNIMSENFPFAVTYYDTAIHRVFSLRSRETGTDVSELATKFGGGGHKHAAGFKVDRNHILAKI